MIGRLVGGVVYDFNNLLLVIFNYVWLIKDELDVDDLLREDVEEIERVVKRGVALIK